MIRTIAFRRINRCSSSQQLLPNDCGRAEIALDVIDAAIAPAQQIAAVGLALQRPEEVQLVLKAAPATAWLAGLQSQVPKTPVAYIALKAEENTLRYVSMGDNTVGELRAVCS